MNAALVYDGLGYPITPASMGLPSPDQLAGTPLENLGELASRICYDSLGSGRSSGKLHEHILDVRHHSVYEHCNFTVWLPCRDLAGRYNLLRALANRKGVWVEFPDSGVEVTANFRAVLEWDRHTPRWAYNTVTARLDETLSHFAASLAPVIFPGVEGEPFQGACLKETGLTDDQAWVTLWLRESRAVLEEQVRHRYAMSMRSTRYVDEGGSPYVKHPLVTKYLEDTSVDASQRADDELQILASIYEDRATYRCLVEHLQEYCVRDGLDKLNARKQARGAARNYLGLGLGSEMLFSAPVSGWKDMMGQRLHPAADGAIRVMYEDVLAAMKASRYGERFAAVTLVPSPDGLGKVLPPRAQILWPP